MTETRTDFSTLRTWEFGSFARAAGVQLVKAVMMSWVKPGRALTRLVRDVAMPETTSATSEVKRAVMHSSRSLVASSSRVVIRRKGWFGRTCERFGSAVRWSCVGDGHERTRASSRTAGGGSLGGRRFPLFGSG